MELRLSPGFRKRLEGRFGKYSFEVGVLNDGPHKQPKELNVMQTNEAEVLSNYAGGPIRKKTSKASGKSIAEVSKANRERLGFNYLSEPFKKKSSDIIKFSNEFFKLAFGRSEKKRAENLLQAIVRNPILKGEYGANTEATAKHKGFNRGMIDTAQLFKAIKAACKVTGK